MKKMCKILAAILSLQMLLGGVTTASASEEIILQLETNDGASSIRDDGSAYVLWYGSGKVWWDNVNVPESGSYKVTLRANAGGTNPNGAKPIISVDGKTVINTTYIPTNNYGPYNEFVLGEIGLLAGNHTIMIANTDRTDSANIIADWLKLEKVGAYPLGNLEDETRYTADICSNKNGVTEITDGDQKAAEFSEYGYVSYNVNSQNEEVYILSASIKTDEGIKIGVYAGDNQKLEKMIEPSADAYKIQELGRILIPSGTTKIKIKAEELSGSAAISDIIFTKLKPGYPAAVDMGYLKVEFEDFGPGGEGVDYHDNKPGKDDTFYVDGYGDVDVGKHSGGLCVGASGGEWLKYHVTIPKTGTYKINVRAAKPGTNTFALVFGESDEPISKTMTATSSWSDYQDFDFGLVELAAGSLTITAEESAGNANLDYFELEQVNTDFSVYSIFTGDDAVVDERVLNRGTDVFSVYFNNDINPESVSGTLVDITSQDGTEILSDISSMNNELKILLKKSLDYEKEYTLTISGISGEYGSLKGQYTATFKTGDNESDFASSSVEITNCDIDYESVTVKGIVKSSQNIGISGRTVTLSVQGEGLNVASAVVSVSETDGQFEFNWQIPQGSNPGTYTFTVTEEYGNSDDGFGIYTSQEYEEQIIGELKLTTRESDVLSWFNSYQPIIGIDVEADTEGFESSDVLLRHFIGADITSVQNLLIEYNKYLALETINNADAEKAEQFLADNDKCAAIGIDASADDVIVTNRQGFINDVTALGDTSEPELFKAEYEKLLDKWIAAEFSKTNVNLTVSNLSAYVGTGVKIPVKFTQAQTDVKKVNLVVESTNSAIINSLTSQGVTADVTEVASQGTKFCLNVSYNEVKEITELGEIQFTAPSLGQHIITISGSVEFEKEYNDKKISFKTEIVPVNVTITVSSQPGYSKPTGGGGGGGASSPSTPSQNKPSQDTTSPDTPSQGADVNETVQNTKFSFSDIDSVNWAKESINYLLNKNVVSENKEKMFYPDRNVTREEFVKMIILAVGAEEMNAVAEFSDVSEDSWFYPYVASAYKAGLIYGNDKGEFGTGQNITRQDMSVILSRALQLAGYEVLTDDAEQFADHDEISDYAVDAIYNMRRLGIMNGVGDNMCSPRSNATRAMAAKMIFDIMKAVGR